MGSEFSPSHIAGYAVFEVAEASSVDRVTSWTDLGYRMLATMTQAPNVDREAPFLSITHDRKSGEIKLLSVDLKSLNARGVVETVESPLKSFYDEAFASASPDGRHGLIRESFKGRLRLADLRSGETEDISKTPVLTQDFTWSNDGRFAIGEQWVVLSKGARSTLTVKVVDIQNSTCRTLDPLADFSDEASQGYRTESFHLLDKRIYAVVNRGVAESSDIRRSMSIDRKYRFALNCYDLSTLDLIKTVSLGEHGAIRSLCVLKDKVLWLAQRSRSRNRDSWTVFSNSLNEPGKIVEGVSSLPEVTKAIASHDGKFILYRNQSSGSFGKSYFILSTDALLDSSAKVSSTSLPWHQADGRPTGRFGSNPPLARWHTDRNQAAVILDSSIKINDLDNESEFQVLLDNADYKQAIPASFGWIIQTDDQLLAYDDIGKYLGCWLNTRSPDAQRFYSFPTRWIHANGSTMGLKRGDGVCLVQLVGNQAITIRQDSASWLELPAETIEALGTVKWPWDE